MINITSIQNFIIFFKLNAANNSLLMKSLIRIKFFHSEVTLKNMHSNYYIPPKTKIMLLAVLNTKQTYFLSPDICTFQQLEF